MFRKLLGKISSNARKLRKIRRIVDRINAHETSIEKLSDSELRKQTEVFRERFENGETLEQLLPEAGQHLASDKRAIRP